MSDNPQDSSGKVVASLQLMTPADIESLSELTPQQIADVQAFAGRFPALDALLNAEKTREGRE